MKFGIHNPSWQYGPDPYQMFEAIKRKAHWAEQHGYVWFSVMDHLIQIPHVGAPDEPFMEGWTTLSALAAVTREIRLATLVSSVAYRNPALLAKMAAGVDIISGGRVTLGIGAGWFQTEYQQYGWEFPARPARRIRQMEEAVRLIKQLWQDKRTTFEGKYFHATDAVLEPKPVQKPHPPVLIGGSGETMTLRAVARVGDACNIFGDPQTVKAKFEVVRRHCEAEQRDYAQIERTNLTSLLLAEDEAALKAKKEKLRAPEPFRGYALTVAQAVELAGRYAEAGSQLFISSFYRNDWESMELLAARVMPQFRG